ncbi:hypothetical protein ACLKA6_016033 [Drosophila palustris]
MYSKVCVLLLAIVLSQAKPQGNLPDNRLVTFMLQTTGLSHSNPERSLSCFDYYLPLLKELADQFKVDYHNCLESAKLARQNVDGSTENNRTQLNDAAMEACAVLSTCSQKSDSIEFFHCYTDAGSDGSKSLYAISANATELLDQVHEKYRIIDISEKSCTSKTERAHTEKTADTYEEFNKCLAGVSPVPEPIPTTTPESTGSAPEDL